MSAWIFALLVSLSAPSTAASLPSFPGWSETSSEREARYYAIAEDIAAASSSESDAAILVAVAWMESGFAPDVDAGRCYRGRSGRSSRCDSGRAVSLWQIQRGAAQEGVDLTDRAQAAREALRMIRRSRSSCGGGDHALELFAAGRCATDATPGILKASKTRLDLARKLLRTPRVKP